MTRPRPIQAGATVALVAGAGPLPEGGIDRAVRRVIELGWEPRVGAHAHQRTGYLAGTDADRLADLNDAIRSPEVDAIWMLRGGYGTMRILPGIDLGALLDNPRPLIGFSDNTAIHLAARRRGLVTFHGPHPAAAEVSDFSLQCLGEVVRGHTGPLPTADDHGVRTLIGGVAEGPLVGGNLALLAATAGTPFQMDAAGAIVFIEEVNEPSYRIDRMLSQLLLAGALEGAAGIVVGAISDRPDQDRDDIPDPDAVLIDRLGELGIPLASGLPFGHISDNWTLPVGITARFDADSGRLELLEPAVQL